MTKCKYCNCDIALFKTAKKEYWTHLMYNNGEIYWRVYCPTATKAEPEEESK